jgi:5'-deoxynucleotidase YfbR-like HD superfamily hydrolase
MAAILETVSGKFFDALDPKPDQIDINDIAWALSRIPRFAGHTIPFVPYSVAQHSVQVMKELQSDNNLTDYNNRNLMGFHGLMHDAAEAYIGDIPSPIKHIPEFHEKIEEIETKILKVIYTSFQIELPTKEEAELVHHADMVQRAIEAYNFMYSRGKDWRLPGVSFQKLQSFEPPLTSVEAYEQFLYHFNDLKGRI